ncbi:DUF1801 domain-containing protein [Marinomonas posidonica]|uniref:YdhG-like domain-containing protein n=1 Tax=Marinomonas posidonica (strain CECT 7376 / NCIMB 14433 / IVIA-Po-181) TaxID=491952 RepID=F6CW33_MARPP|nr:DUF1801 domain-containing protein [Marinomonas posidonica]AEF54332.1 hypothetical protein Mar181_1285 [Marinomonas posidonica IVIA-Po-181]
MQSDIENKFDAYPADARQRLYEIRRLIFEMADELKLGVITEELKWGEASYCSKIGSPIRLDWKEKHPNQVSLFVHCQTQLMETYKELYADRLAFVGKREIQLPLSAPMPLTELRSCIAMALQYHQLKHLPLLGA